MDQTRVGTCLSWAFGLGDRKLATLPEYGWEGNASMQALGGGHVV